MKNYPRLTKRMLMVLRDFPGNTIAEKEQGMNQTLRKVASAAKDNVDPNDDTLLDLKALIYRVYKKRHLTNEMIHILFNVFITLFGGAIPTFGKFIADNLPTGSRLVTLSSQDDLRRAGFNMDIREDQWGRFPITYATLNFGNVRYKGAFLATSSNMEEIKKFLVEGVIGNPALIIWGSQPNGYRYLEKKGLKTNFAIIYSKETSKLH